MSGYRAQSQARFDSHECDEMVRKNVQVEGSVHSDGKAQDADSAGEGYGEENTEARKGTSQLLHGARKDVNASRVFL